MFARIRRPPRRHLGTRIQNRRSGSPKRSATFSPISSSCAIGCANGSRGAPLLDRFPTFGCASRSASRRTRGGSRRTRFIEVPDVAPLAPVDVDRVGREACHDDATPRRRDARPLSGLDRGALLRLEGRFFVGDKRSIRSGRLDRFRDGHRIHPSGHTLNGRSMIRPAPGGNPRGPVRYAGYSHVVASLNSLERQVVVLEARGSSPLGHPRRQAAAAPAGRGRLFPGVCVSVGSSRHAPPGPNQDSDDRSVRSFTSSDA